MKNTNISKQIQILINQFKVQNYDYIISKGNTLLKKNPEYLILYNIIGSAYQNNGDYVNAKQKFKDGLKLDPNNIALLNNLGLSHKNLLEYDLAEELYLKTIKINKNYANAYINLGNLKRDLNQFDDAITYYNEALLISKQNPVIFYSLALAHQGIGNFQKSIFYATEALKIDPNFTRADHLISQSKKYNVGDQHYLNLKNKLINFRSDTLEKVDIYFSLAKANEDIGNIKETAENLITGNKLKRKLLKYNIDDEINLLKDIKKKFTGNEYITSNKDNDNNIIFILGMPRSGTSLVEQIISSHKNVFGGGELPILPNIIKDNLINDEKNFKKDFFEIINNPTNQNNMREKYINFIKNFKYTQQYITDKAPLNFRWIGFINLIFPNTKIIHCTRDPKNNCLSMFKNLFEGGLNFTYSQEDLVKYYKNYQDLMNFWKSKYPNKILDVGYENLIENSEIEIKKIIKFCNLEWDENCLSFHKNKSPIKTMSTSQARKPIYKSSIKAFDKFKGYFNILESEL